jgi:hypothetical protein
MRKLTLESAPERHTSKTGHLLPSLHCLTFAFVSASPTLPCPALRSICLGKLQDHRMKTDAVWVTGYQKALSLSSLSDWGSLFAGRNMERAR